MKINRVIVYRFFILLAKMIGISFCVLFLGLIQGCRAKNSTNTYDLYLSALESYSQKDFSETLASCDSIIKNDKSFFQAELLRVKALCFLCDFETAEESIESLVKRVPQYTDARLWHIRLLILQEKFEQVAPLLEKELSLNETDWRIHYLKGLLDSRNENYSGQLVSLQQAERALSDGAKVYLDLTKLWLVLGMEDQAEKHLEKARILVPSQGELKILFETLETLTKNQEKKNEV